MKKTILLLLLASCATAFAGNVFVTNDAHHPAQVVCVSGCGGGGGGTPGGSTTQVQYNNAGAFGGITGATTNGTALTLVAPVLGTPASGTLTNCTFPTLNQSTTGSAATLTTGRTISLTGDVTYTSGSFNGSANVTGTATLANIPAIAGTNLTGTADNFTAGSVTRNHATYASASPPTVDVGQFSVAVTGVDLKNSNTTSGFTVPTGRTFVCVYLLAVATSVTTPGAGTLTIKAQESGTSQPMTAATQSGSATPAVGSYWYQQDTAGGSPYKACTAGNIVQLVIGASNAGSTAVVGTVYIFGFYSS